jgi:predicted DNA-binding ribbon-helix-helix protein
MRQHLQTRNLTISDRRTSVRLEPIFWNGLREIADKRNMTIHELAREILNKKPRDSSLTSALRTYIVGFYRAMALEPSVINRFLKKNYSATPDDTSHS